MDNSLKKLESQLETLCPRGLSDDAKDRCDQLIDELTLGQSDATRSPIGWSWKVTSIAASIVLCIGMTSGWWLGQNRESSTVAEVAGGESQVASAFDLIDERSWLQFDGSPQLYLSDEGEVTELRTEIGVSEETVLHRDTGRLVTVRVTTRLPIREATNQF